MTDLTVDLKAICDEALSRVSTIPNLKEMQSEILGNRTDKHADRQIYLHTYKHTQMIAHTHAVAPDTSLSGTVNHKKRDILFLTIILANLNRFLQFLYHFNREEILHATVVKFTTSS